MRTVLMIAFHFPPFAGSSGVQRTLRFVQNLPALGWRPVVLTVRPAAYEQTSDDLLSSVPEIVKVHRSVALDAQRHLSWRGRYPGFLARPDRWASWAAGAVPGILKLIRTERPAIVWSTYPIATAHIVGAMAHRWSGVPWVADFRDPMAQDGYPEDPATWRWFSRIERHALEHAAASVFTTRGAADTYKARYPDCAPKVVTIENGYDEESFAGIEDRGQSPLRGKVILLHSGVVYPVERDPSALFAALARLKQGGELSADTFGIRFRASGQDALIERLARGQGVADLIELAPSLSYRAALAEMVEADGLLVLQASNCNEQIPAKTYEYLRTYRPIVGLADPAGDTGDLLKRSGVPYLSSLHDVDGIVGVLRSYLADAAAGTITHPAPDGIRGHSRAARSRQLAELFDRVAS